MTLGGLRFFSWLQRLPPSVAVATSALGPLLSRPCGLASHSGHSPGRRRPCLGPGSAVQGVWWLFPGPPCAPLKGGGQQLAGSRPRASVCMCVCTCVFPHVCPYLTCKNAPYSAPPHPTLPPQPPLTAITFPLPGILEPARPCPRGSGSQVVPAHGISTSLSYLSVTRVPSCLSL